MNLDSSALEILKKSLPTKKDEAWKFTSLTDFKSMPWQFNVTPTHLTHDQMQKLSRALPAEYYNLVFVNGILDRTLSDELTSHIQILEVIDGDLDTNASHPEHNILKLANACLANRMQITISDQQTFEKPIHIVYAQTAKVLQYSSARLDINVGMNAEVVLMVQTVNINENEQCCLNLNISLNIADRARVKFIQIDNSNLQSYQFSQNTVRVGNDVSFQTFTMSLGNRLSRNYFELEFLGQGADAGVYGLNALNSNQHSDHYTFIRHATGGNNSQQLYKSILSDSAHSVFRGRVRIEKDAQKANSEQLNNNLLLTREAHADSIPQLEIYADDVKAGHGSTVGQLDKEEIFYFLSRGINQYQAVKMLSFGYAQELIYKFENKQIQEWLLKNLNEKLDRMIQNV